MAVHEAGHRGAPAARPLHDRPGYDIIPVDRGKVKEGEDLSKPDEF